MLYDTQARIIPAIAGWGPSWIPWGILAVYVYLSGGGTLDAVATLAALGTGGGVASIMLVGEGRKRGWALQEELWAKWGGPPTTRWLRYEDETLDPLRKVRLHEWIRRQGIELPDRDAPQDEGDGTWEVGVARMRSTTRGSAPVESTNRLYGYRRNLLGYRRLGWTQAAISLIAMPLTAFVGDWTGNETWTDGALLGLLGLVAWGWWWRGAPSEEKVKEAAEEYARQLFEAVV